MTIPCTWIYFLKAKSEVFERFREFKTLVENQTGKKIRVLRIDNGGEYNSNEFMEYCSAEGIKIAYVSGQHSTRHQHCSQLFESVHGGSSESALDGCEAHPSLHQRYSGVWIGL